MKENAVLELHNIYKIFPGVKALQDVDFTLREGEIHALMGENGAGKSTLIKVITGVYEKEEGKIFLKGNESEVNIHSPQDAQNLGISTVYQEITLCPNLTVAENMFIGRTKSKFTNWKKMNEEADRILKSLDIAVSAANGFPYMIQLVGFHIWEDKREMCVAVSIIIDSSLNCCGSKNVKFSVPSDQEFDIFFLHYKVVQEFVKAVFYLNSTLYVSMSEKADSVYFHALTSFDNYYIHSNIVYVYCQAVTLNIE